MNRCARSPSPLATALTIARTGRLELKLPERLRKRASKKGHFLGQPNCEAIFSPETLNGADWPLLRNGAVNLFSRRQDYAAMAAALDGLGYRMLIFAREPEHFIDEMSAALKWREQFGYEPWSGNLDAFNDALRGEPFDTADDSAICIENFHMLVANDEAFARGLLDIIEHHSRHYLLFGKRLIALVYTQDKGFRCEGLGGRIVMSG